MGKDCTEVKTGMKIQNTCLRTELEDTGQNTGITGQQNGKSAWKFA